MNGKIYSLLCHPHLCNLTNNAIFMKSQMLLLLLTLTSWVFAPLFELSRKVKKVVALLSTSGKDRKKEKLKIKSTVTNELLGSN